MKNNRGSILVITMGFVLVFTLLGIASIYLGTVNSEAADKREFSEEAFWHADGAVERARSTLPNVELKDPANLGDPLPSYGNDVNGNPMTYSVNTVKNGPFTWQIDTDSTVNNQKRAIQAIADASGIAGFGDLNSNGNIDKYNNGDKCTSLEGSSEVNCDKVEEGMSLDFSEVFPNALPVNSSNPNLDNYYTDANAGTFGTIPNSGLTLIEISSTSNMNTKISGSGFVYIDYSNYDAANKKAPSVDIEIADFSGILWIEGDVRDNVDVKFTGNGGYVGAIFVEGSGKLSFGGAAHLNYDMSGNPVPQQDVTDALAGALAQLEGDNTPQCPPDCPGKPTIVAWKEL